MNKKIIIDNDTSKLIDEKEYLQIKKESRKVKLYIGLVTLIFVIIGLSWSFIYYYNIIQNNELIKGKWICNNNIELIIESSEYTFNYPNGKIEEGKYKVTSAKNNKDSREDNYLYFFLEFLKGDQENTANYIVKLDKVNKESMTFINESSKLETKCQIKK